MIFRQLSNSLPKKISLIIMLTVIGTLSIAMSGFIYNEIKTLKQRSLQEKQLIAKVVANYVAVDLVFESKDTAINTISYLKSNPDIKNAYVYNAQGEYFISLYPDQVTTKQLPSMDQSWFKFNGNKIEIVETISEKNRLIGFLYLEVTDHELDNILYQRIILALLYISLLILIAALIARKLTRVVTDPISSLAESANYIADTGVLTPITINNSEDEVGQLIYAFNHMLEQISTREMENKRFRQALDNSLDNSYLIDPETMRFIDFNHATQINTGYTSLELEKLNPSQLLLNYSTDQLQAIYHNIDIENGKATVLETMLQRKDGSTYPIEMRLSAWIDKTNKLTVISMEHDITERKQNENELRNRQAFLELEVAKRTKELEHKNNALESFNYSVSHDLRSPLRSISGFAAILSEDYQDSLDNEGKNYLFRIEKSTKRMNVLINDLLSLSRISQKPLHKKQTNLAPIAQEVSETLKENHSDKEITFIIPDTLDAFGDASLIRIVFENLLQNAVKYSSKKAHIIIEVGIKNNENNHTTKSSTIFFIKDNGAGFDMTYVDKLFGVFQRLHTESQFEGTGIGLATVARIIDKHGGSIWAEAEVNKGATFYFTLE